MDWADLFLGLEAFAKECEDGWSGVWWWERCSGFGYPGFNVTSASGGIT
jgi:hypothetical protein